MFSPRKNFQAQSAIWLSVSEAARLGGVQDKTIRRALKADQGLNFKITKNRYQIELASLIICLHQNTKLKNKLSQKGLGQYIENWRLFLPSPEKIKGRKKLINSPSLPNPEKIKPIQ